MTSVSPLDVISTDLARIEDVLTHAGEHADQLEAVEDWARAALVLEMLGGIGRNLTELRHSIETAVGNAMGKGKLPVDGVGVFERHPNTSYRSTPEQTDDLIRMLLDTRLVDPLTGEVRDESPLDKVRAVFPISARDARSTVLKERGLDKSEFVERETRGWRVQVK